LSTKAQLDLFTVPITIVADYPDMFIEYHSAKDQLEEI